MNLYVKNKMMSVKGSSFVLNDEAEKVFEVKGKFFSPTCRKLICDKEGNLLYTVRNQYFHLFTKKALIYDAQGNKYCKVKERWIGRVTDVRDCPDNIVFQGNGLGKGVSMYKNGSLMGTWFIDISSASDLFRDSFRIEVVSEGDAALLTALMIAVDNIRDSRRS